MPTSWYSDDEEVWIVLSPGMRLELQAYASKREAKRASGPGQLVFPLTIWREGRYPNDQRNH